MRRVPPADRRRIRLAPLEAVEPRSLVSDSLLSLAAGGAAALAAVAPREAGADTQERTPRPTKAGAGETLDPRAGDPDMPATGGRRAVQADAAAAIGGRGSGAAVEARDRGDRLDVLDAGTPGPEATPPPGPARAADAAGGQAGGGGALGAPAAWGSIAPPRAQASDPGGQGLGASAPPVFPIQVATGSDAGPHFQGDHPASTGETTGGGIPGTASVAGAGGGTRDAGGSVERTAPQPPNDRRTGLESTTSPIPVRIGNSDDVDIFEEGTPQSAIFNVGVDLIEGYPTDLRIYLGFRPWAIDPGNDEARIGEDFLIPSMIGGGSSGAPGYVILPANQMSVDVTVTAVDDDLDELNPDDIGVLYESVEIYIIASAETYDEPPEEVAHFRIHDGAPSGRAQIPTNKDDNKDDRRDLGCDCDCGCGEVSTDPKTGQVTYKPSGNGQVVCGAPNSSFRSDGNPHPIVSFDWTLPSDTLPTMISATLDFGGVVGPTVYYDTTGRSLGQTVVIGLQVDASSLPTGRYDYEVDVTSHYTSGDVTQTLVGAGTIFNLIDGPYGNRWWFDDLDRILPGTDGVTLLRGDSSSAWFWGNGSGGYLTPDGSTSYLAAGVVGGWVLTFKDGSYDDFDDDGLLVARVDRNGNTTSYRYTDGNGDSLAEELAGVTDPYGRLATYSYDDGRLQTRSDFYGRVTTYAYDSGGRLTSITQVDPDGAGPLSSSLTTFSYDGHSLLTQIHDAAGGVTTIGYDAFLRAASVARPGLPAATITSIAVRGLVDTSTGSGTALNPAPLTLASDAKAVLVDATGRTTTLTTDRFGYVTREVDPLGNVTTYERDRDGRLTQLTEPDPDGGGSLVAPVTTYAYDARGNLTGVTLPDGATQAWEYDFDLNQVTSYRDENNLTSDYSLDSHGNALTELDPLGRTTSFAYDGHGNLTGVTRPDPDGVGPLTSPTTTYAYDSLGRLTTITFPGAATQKFAFDIQDNLVGQTDELGRVTSYTYDAMGRATSATSPDPDGAGSQASLVSSRAYRPDGLVERITDPYGRVTTYAYDAARRLTTVTAPDPDGAGSQTSPVTTYAYDAEDRLTRMTDPLGRVTSYAYDAGGRAVAVTAPDPDGAGPLASPITTLTYDNLGRVIAQVDPLGRTTSFAYDVRDRLTTLTAPDPDGGGAQTSPVTRYAYDPGGRLLSETDPLSRTTTYTYDSGGQLTSVKLPDPDGGGVLTSPITTFTYDELGRLTRQTDPLGRVTSYAYDVRDRLTTVTAPDPDGAGSQTSPVTAYAYDAVGNRTTVTDPLGQVATTVYDGLDRVVEIWAPDPDGAGPAVATATAYGYAADGTSATTTRQGGDVTTYAYDALGRLTAVVQADPDGVGPLTAPVTASAYDLAGNLTSVTDPAGNTTTYAYDALDRVTTITDPRGKTTTFSFDVASQVTAKTDRLGRSTAYAYDDLGRLTNERWLDSLGGTVRTVSYAYDAAGQLTSVADPDALLTFTYDELGRRLSEATSGPGTGQPALTLTSAYDAVGNRTRLADSLAGSGGAGQGVTTYSYDALDRLTTIARSLGGVAGPRVVLGYDAAGRLTSTARTIAGAGTSVNSAYAYDARDRLTTITHQTDAGTALASYAYAYDADDRLASETNAEGTRTYSYDRTDQLTAAGAATYSYDEAGNRTMTGYTTDDANRLVASPGFTYTYDDEGDLASRTETATGAVTTYAYDYHDRMTGATRKDSGGSVLMRATYTYDALGRRIGTLVDRDGDGTTDSPERTWTAYDGDHAYADFDAAGAVQMRYLHGPAVDMLLARTDAAAVTSWYLTDRLGTVRDVASTAGTVIYHAAFDEFGNRTAESGSGGDRWGYTGREFDRETGFQYNRARYYDAAIGRWSSQDPIGFAAGDANLYRYVNNEPTGATDPTGLQSVPGNYKPHPWPVPDPANTIVLIGPPKFKNGKPDPNDSNPFKRQVCRAAGIPDRNVFDYNGIQSLLDAVKKAKKLGLKKPHVVTWGHARPGGILVGVNPANGSFTDRFDKNSGANTLGNLLKSLGTKDYYNLGCNTFDHINPSGPNGWDFFNAVQKAAGNIPIYGTVGYDMPGQNLDQAINGDPPCWYMEPGGHIVVHKPK